MSALVSVEGLRHTYPAKGKTAAREALKGVSFEVQAGETFGLLGPNGGGKSTTFRILSTYFPPDAGRVTLFGLDLQTSAAEIRRRIGVVFQNASLDAKLTVAENMKHQGHLYGLSGAELSKRIDELLERYKLSDRRGDLAGSLSGGLRRRVDIAKGLLHRPELILLDEPSTGLDPGARRDLWQHLGDLKKERQVTLIVTTHLMDEAEHCDRVVLLDLGAIAAAGTPAALKAQIGGDVITIESSEPEALREKIKQKFGQEPTLVGSTLRMERGQGHAFIPQLVEAFPGLVQSVSLSKPTLEDVFIHHTGRRL
jgi:ABC-2 type transport system ATP-binding protein